MRAWTFTNRGPPSKVLKLRHDLPQPQPTDLQPDEVLVKVSYVSIFAPQANLMAVVPHFNSDPQIPGYEFSGVVVASSESTFGEKLFEGQEVFGMIDPKRRKYKGALADYIIVPRDCVTQKPSTVSLEEASAVTVGCTVIGVLEKAGLLEVDYVSGGYQIRSRAKGNKILITGGSTNTGISTIQLVRTLVGTEGQIVTTCSPRNVEAVRSYGADEIINYTQNPDLHKYLTEHHSTTPFDAIIDITGSDPLLYQNCPVYLKPNGAFAFAGNMSRTHRAPDPGLLGTLIWLFNVVSLVLEWLIQGIRPVILGGVPRRSFFHSGQITFRNLSLVRQLVADRNLKGVVDSVWDMEDVVKAFDHLAKGRVRGKVVIKVGG